MTTPPIPAEALLAALPQAVLLVDAKGVLQLANQTAEALLGHSAHQLVGRNLTDIPAFSDALHEMCRRARQSGESLSLFDDKLYLFHSTLQLSAHVVPLGEALLITLENTDGLHKLLSRSAKNEATRASGIMAAMLAHEVKNPLSGIRGAAQLLGDEVSGELQPLAELITAEVDRIRDLLNQVEIFTAGSPQRSAVNIHEVLQYVIHVARSGFAKHVQVVERYDPSLPPVLAHRDLLVQLCLNLVKNAAEALVTGENPTITITTYYQSGYRLRPGEHEEAVALPVAIDIEDNGPGILEAVRSQLFEPFRSTKDEGRGLGLAVVAKIAADLGASIELGEKPTPGARFTVRLAVAK
jgi:two-component system, NtrC family, nitrogen regulation sensor histidine kinase GlnL